MTEPGPAGSEALPATDTDPAALRAALVARLKAGGSLRTPEVEAAFRAVPRHHFLPGVPLGEVYEDAAIATKYEDGVAISSSSQPAIMAIMLEQLAVQPGQRVLEIGAGTGFNAALLAHLAGEEGQVVTVDLDEDIVTGARMHLAAAILPRVQVIQGDGWNGYAPRGPYDRIILTCGAQDIAPAWREQLAPGGRLVLPLEIRGVQHAVAFEQAANHLASVSATGCGFMMLRGPFAGSTYSTQIGPNHGLVLTVVDAEQLDSGAVYGWLQAASREVPTGVEVTLREIWGALDLWLALRNTGFCNLTAVGPAAGVEQVAFLLGTLGQYLWSHGLLNSAGLCLWQRPAAPLSEDGPFALAFRCLGAGDDLAAHLKSEVVAWDAAARPFTRGLTILAYPTGVPVSREDGTYLVQARESQFVLRPVEGGEPS